MKISIVRHGQTDWNAISKIQGQNDISLNETGIEQAKETSGKLKGEKIDLIISSPLERAKETASIINKNHNVQIIYDKRLMERGYGKLEGLTKEEIKIIKEQHQEMNDMWDYSKEIKTYDVESMKEFCDRIYEFWDETIKKYKDKNVLIVSHGGVSVITKCYFMKMPLESVKDRDSVKGINNCEILKYEI